jgi:hypothetical protein
MTRCLEPQDESLLVNILINASYNFISFIKLKTGNKGRDFISILQPERTALQFAALTILITP